MLNSRRSFFLFSTKKGNQHTAVEVVFVFRSHVQYKENSNGSISADWRWWGQTLTEAGYDTLTIVAIVTIVLKVGLDIDFAELMDNLFGKTEALAWIPFWVCAMVPFMIRMYLFEPVLLDEEERLD